jgi:hypothetical protein
MRSAIIVSCVALVACARVCAMPVALDAGQDAAAEASAPALLPRCTDAPGVKLARDDQPVEMGQAANFGNRLALGMNIAGRASVVLATRDANAPIETHDLGAADPNAPPPAAVVGGGDLYVAHVAQSPRRIVIDKIADNVKTAWEVPIASGDVEFDVGVAHGAGLVAWTFGDRMFVAALGKEPRAFAKDIGDLASPRVLPREGGFLVAYLVTRTQAADAAPWYDKDAAPEGAGSRLERGWVEMASVDLDGRAAAPAAITSPSGRVTSFDWIESGPDAIDLVARDAVSSGEGAGLVQVHIQRGVASPARELGGDLGIGAPIALAPGASEVWVAFTDTSESIHLLAVGGRETKESAFGDARPLLVASAGPNMFVAAVRVGRDGRGAELKVLACRR